MSIIELLKKSFEVEIVTCNGKSFGEAWLPDIQDESPTIAVAIGTCLLCSQREKIPVKTVILETLMHEFGHVIERWLDLEIDEERVESIDMKYNVNQVQEMPKNGSQKVLDFVLQDLIERAEIGKKKYNTYLETNNGRDALLDAYQEALDLVMYLRQLILEREE